MELKTFFAQDLFGNVIPSPTVAVYQPGTTTLVTGLQNASGAALTNPFNGDGNGQVVFAAPDGDYDMRVEGAGRTTTMRVRFIDSGTGTVQILRDDLVSPASGKGAELIGFKQSGAGAVARTAQSKMQEIVSVKDFGAVDGMVADDTLAIQKALDAGGEFSSVWLTGVHRITAKLKLHKGQRLVGGSDSWFINTNSGTTWAGPLSGTLPKYGIFYDSSTGEAIETEEGSILEGFHLWGRGYTTLGVDIQKPNPATIHAATGVKNTKFLAARNLSVYYFQTAFHSTGGDYYSRYDHVEVTRCTKAFKWDLATFNQIFNGCVLRVVDMPFEFASYARGIKWFGGSIEGYTQKTQIRPYSSLYFSGTYFETMNDLAVIPSVFEFIGGAALLKIEGCDVYLNHCLSFVNANNQQGLTIQSSGNRFVVNSGSITAVPVAYSVPSTALNGRYSLKNDAFLNDDADIRAVTTGSINSGSTALTIASAIVSVGQRIVVIGAGAAGADLTTTATAVSGTSVTLRDPAGTTVSGATVNTYTTAVYVPYTMGTGILGFEIVPPVDSLPRFTDVEFGGRRAFGLQAQTAAPVAVFNGGAAGLAVYTADGTSWNPANKADGRGAYPVAYRGGKYIPMLGGFVGSFTLSSANTKVVSETNISANSKVFLMPTNAAAATLMQSTKSLFVSAKSVGTSFTVATADGTNAAGTEAFDFFIYD